MAELTGAYEVLMDKNKRTVYDQQGAEGLKRGGGGQQQQQQQRYHTGRQQFRSNGGNPPRDNPFSHTHKFSNGGNFDNFFTSGSSQGQQRQRQRQQQQQQQQRKPPSQPDLYDFMKETSLISLSKEIYPTKKTREIWFVQFYSPKCLRSKSMKNTMTKLAFKLTREYGIKVGVVNCQIERDLCREHTRETPVMKLYLPFTRGRSLKHAALYDDSTGDFTAASVLEFLGRNIAPQLVPTTANPVPGGGVIVHNLRVFDQALTFAKDTIRMSNSIYSNRYGLVFITTEYEPSLLIRSLAYVDVSTKVKSSRHIEESPIDGVLKVAEIRGNNVKLARKFGIELESRTPGTRDILTMVCATTNGNLYANQPYSGNLKDRAGIERWMKTFQDKAKCDEIIQEADNMLLQKRNHMRTILSQSKEELGLMSGKALRSVMDELNINSASLIDKNEYIDAIYSHGIHGDKAKRERAPDL